MSAAKSSKSSKKSKQNPVSRSIANWKKRADDYLKRRPHRSLQRTRRRDYVRSLSLPGYWSFTNHVRQTLWSNRRLFGGLVLTYAFLTALLVGVASQEAYSQLGQVLSQTSDEIFSGNFSQLAQAGLLLASGLTGGLSASMSAVQQLYAVLIMLLTWLTTVWLLRSILSGRRPKLRDGLYNSMAPLLSTFLVAVIMMVQLLPVGIAAVGFSAANASGLLDGGVEAMLFWSVAALLTVLSIYWVTSTFIALVVVTLPGMYPWQAIKTAGDLVIGRRLRIIFRLLWLGLTAIVACVAVMLPIILFDRWIKDVWPAIEWLPLVPLSLLLVGSLIVVWAASYVYLFYRKVVEDDAAPA